MAKNLKEIGSFLFFIADKVYQGVMVSFRLHGNPILEHGFLFESAIGEDLLYTGRVKLILIEVSHSDFLNTFILYHL